MIFKIKFNLDLFYHASIKKASYLSIISFVSPLGIKIGFYNYDLF